MNANPLLTAIAYAASPVLRRIGMSGFREIAGATRGYRSVVRAAAVSASISVIEEEELDHVTDEVIGAARSMASSCDGLSDREVFRAVDRLGSERLSDLVRTISRVRRNVAIHGTSAPEDERFLPYSPAGWSDAAKEAVAATLSELRGSTGRAE